MKFRTMAAAVAALSLATSPAMAQSVDRVSAPVSQESEMGGSSTLLLVLAVVLFGAGIFFLVDNDDDDPDSP
jgi:predicted transporter